MAEAKKSAKGQKIGRNSRAPSNQMQERRTEKNKRINGERAQHQMAQGGKTEEVYHGFHQISPAIKFVSGCMSLWDAKQRRIRIQRELAVRK